MTSYPTFDDLTSPIPRIQTMESRFDRVGAVLGGNWEGGASLIGLEEDLAALRGYYDGGQWRSDFEADGRGELPEDLKRGVLSEDGLWNLLEEADASPIAAIATRHSVRRYLDKPIEPEKVATLREAAGRINRESGLNIQLVLDEPRAFSAGMLKYGMFRGVRNYLVMAGPKGPEAEERIGWYGEELVLLARTLGLNSCWVGLTYKKIPGTFTLRDGDTVHADIALGYGESQGVQHPLRPLGDFVEAEGELPGWFRAGMEAALLAPTAINQQKFKFILHPGGVVEARAQTSLAGYARMDLGIVKYHFQLAAGAENFNFSKKD